MSELHAADAGKALERIRSVKRAFWIRLVAVLIVFAGFTAVFMYVATNLSHISYSVDYLKEGDIADKDIIASSKLKYVDWRMTDRMRYDIRNKAPKVYHKDDLISMGHVLDFDRAYPEYDAENAVARDAISQVYSKGYFNVEDIIFDSSEFVILDGMHIPKDEVLHSRSVDGFLEKRFSITENSIPSLSEIKRYLFVNVRYDYASTMRKIADAIAKAPAVVVEYEKGDVIIAKDEIITGEMIERLRDVREHENTLTLSTCLFRLLTSLIVLLIGFYAVNRFLLASGRRRMGFFLFACFCQFLHIALIFLTYAVMVRFPDTFLYDSRSFAFLPSCLLLFVTGNKPASCVMLAMSLILVISFPFVTAAFAAKSLIAGIAVFFLRYSFSKDGSGDCIKGVLFTLAAHMAMIILIDLGFYPSDGIAVADLTIECLKLGVSGALAFSVTRLFARIFRLPTKQVLLRLIYGSNPLIDRFKSSCKGSYEHCAEVMGIAMAAAQAVGCDSLLVGAAARYHDIGKMRHPEYFVENNPDESRHKRLTSRASARIIKSHVTSGIEEIERSGLMMPYEVISLIREHHGNDLITYFYVETLKEQGNVRDRNGADAVIEEYFRYDSRRPSTKESAILMLSDISEAACRSLKAHSPKLHRDFLHRLFMRKLEDGQLDDSGITAGDLMAVEDTIVEKMDAMYNSKRIAYQGDDTLS